MVDGPVLLLPSPCLHLSLDCFTDSQSITLISSRSGKTHPTCIYPTGHPSSLLQSPVLPLKRPLISYPDLPGVCLEVWRSGYKINLPFTSYLCLGLHAFVCRTGIRSGSKHTHATSFNSKQTIISLLLFNSFSFIWLSLIYTLLYFS